LVDRQEPRNISDASSAENSLLTPLLQIGCKMASLTEKPSLVSKLKSPAACANLISS
jgi:hypothetical protein